MRLFMIPGALLATLEHLTEPSDLAEADQGAGECCEGEMDVGSALISDGQAAVAGQPGEGAFHDPAVSAEVAAALDPTPGNAWGYAAGAALLAYPSAEYRG